MVPEQALRKIIRAYKKVLLSRFERCESLSEEQAFKQYDFPTALKKATLSKCPNGKRAFHQRRIPGNLLDHWYRCCGTVKARRGLLSAEKFNEIYYTLIEIRDGRELKGIGALTVYDTALRIAFNRGRRLYPQQVFLHAGSLVGARALLGQENIRGKMVLSRLDFTGGSRIVWDEFMPHEIEDFLCCCRRCFIAYSSGPRDTTEKRENLFWQFGGCGLAPCKKSGAEC